MSSHEAPERLHDSSSSDEQQQNNNHPVSRRVIYYLMKPALFALLFLHQRRYPEVGTPPPHLLVMPVQHPERITGV